MGIVFVKDSILRDGPKNKRRSSGGIKGEGYGAFAPQSEALPPLAPSQKEKNGQNQPFLANFWIFAPSETHFAPSMPPTKKKNKQTNKQSGAATAPKVREFARGKRRKFSGAKLLQSPHKLG